MLGGYFNVFIPLNEQDAISETYQRFLANYDADLIVLAPDMTKSSLASLLVRTHPFCIVPWEATPQIAILDPLSGSTGINLTMDMKWAESIKKANRTYVAVADKMCTNTSRLALVACGDIEPREPMLEATNGVIDLDAIGFRETFLGNMLKPGYSVKFNASTHIEDIDTIVPAPNRYQLRDLISEEYQFPLSDPVSILDICGRLQNHTNIYQSFIGLTAHYKTTSKTVSMNERAFAMVILVSDSFSLEEGVLFWNLRASGFYVSWLSFIDVENNVDALVKWLEYDYGGGYYSLVMGQGSDIVFASTNQNIARLQLIFNELQGKRKEKTPILWRIETYEKLVFYSYARPCFQRERVSIINDGSKFMFIPKLQVSTMHFTGECTSTLEWNGLMLPQNDDLVQNKISSAKIQGFLPSWKNGRRVNEQAIIMSRFRITRERYLEIQINDETPVEFLRPSPEQVFETLFTAAGFSRIEQSSTARYHANFINRAGSLQDATHYLTTTPYRELFEVLIDNENKNKPGWILDPSKRRVLHHLHIREILGALTPSATNKYFDTVSDELPDTAIDLLKKKLLERGFLLKCSACSFRSWYPVEHVGQTFECARCFHSQIYESNPLWLYKLPEVIFQGFANNMQVPLLSLDYFRRMSRHYFEWMSDSDVYVNPSDKKVLGNIDILCICDGKLYIGEAKSNDKIDENQISFYERISRQVAVDGIVFATTTPKWSVATLERIKRLEDSFEGEVITLTGNELYSDKA